MNKKRLNQILETLLFPLKDCKMGKQDYLFDCYQIYKKINEGNKSLAFLKYNSEYRKTRNILIEYLVEKNHWQVKGEDDVEKLCDFFYSMQGIDEYMKQAVAQGDIGQEVMSSYYILETIPLISNNLITYRDGVAAIRPWVESKENKKEIFNNLSVFNKIEIWNLLSRICNPDIFIAAAAVECGLGMEALYEQRTSLVLADKLLVKSLQNGLAENHLHFNAGYEYDSLWLGFMDLGFLTEKYIEKRDDFIKCAIFRYVAASFLEENASCFVVWLENQEKIGRNVKKIIFNLYSGNELNIGEQTIFELNHLYIFLNLGNDLAKKDYLLDSVYHCYKEYKTTSEYLLLFQCYQYVKKRQEDFEFSHLFLQYIRIKNEFFIKSHETNILQGLQFFQKKYAFAAGEFKTALFKEERMVDIFRSQAQIKYLKKLEIRIASEPDVLDVEQFEYSKNRLIIMGDLYGKLLDIFSAYRRFLLETAMGIEYTGSYLQKEKMGIYDEDAKVEIRKRLSSEQVPNIGIVFHLLKRRYLENEAEQFCWKTILKNKEGISTHYLPRRYYIRNIALAIEDIRKTIPKIDEYIVGIDAASDENSEEPWMYAMAYQKVRSRENTVPVNKVGKKYGRLQNIGFTYHVGEDFRHVVSGLRHISEVIEEFGYKPGDRLGHATVLGLDMRTWIFDNEIVLLPRREYLENLLWMWGMTIYEDVELGISLEKVEDKILRTAKKIFGQLENVTVQLLYQAYKEKFNSTHYEIVKKELESISANSDKSTFCCTRSCHYKNGCRGWTKDTLLLTNYCPYFQKRSNEIMVVKVGEDELNQYEILQNYLIKKIEKKGIYIETNPTSNLVIGEFSELDKHPIFSLNQTDNNRANHVLVTVNSDDPAVFGTNIENELAYIYYAAESKGYAKETILEWIDKIRVHGMNASFIQVDKDAETVFNEIENIIEHIQKRLYGGIL